MQQRRQKLEEIKIQEPCPASWEEMEGSEARRYCDKCDLHVQNLSAMPRNEAEEVLAVRAEGAKLCVRVEYLPGGQCVTAETPRAVLTGPGRIAAAAIALGASLAACSSSEPVSDGEPEQISNITLQAEEECMLLGAVAVTWEQGEPQEESQLVGDVMVPEDDFFLATLGEACPEPEPPVTDSSSAEQQVMMGTPGPSRPEDR